MDAVFRFGPRWMAVLGLGPFALGVWWLTWVVTADTIERSRNWKPCVATLVVDKDEKRFLECELEGKPVRVEAPNAKPFRSWSAGDQQRLLMNPANPNELTNGGAAELWASTAMLGFFGIVLVGSMIFMWRVDTPADMKMADLPDGEPTARKQMFASGHVIVLRQAKNAWKANLFWAGILGVLATVSVGGILEGEWIAWLFFALFAAGIRWLVRESMYNKSFELRSEGKRVWIQSCRGEETLAANDFVKMQDLEGETFRFVDAKGKTRLVLSMDMGERMQVAEVVRRLDPASSPH
jgi:hypothetical protein